MMNDSIWFDTADDADLTRLQALGFRAGDKGTHTCRTMMLEELTLLLAACPTDASRTDFARAVVEQNCLGKRTLSTRRLTLQRLSELYALDPAVPLFRIFRRHWQADERGRPLLALLTALARDPLLRLTAALIMELKPGEEYRRLPLVDALRAGTGERLNESTVEKVVRNAASTWTQAGHLAGRVRKIRQTVHPTPAVAAYAMLLGYAQGLRGRALLGSMWTHVLDTAADALIFQAMDAKRLGLLDLSQSGGVLAVTFARVLTGEERRLIHGTH
jgi:hypothetical protein